MLNKICFSTLIFWGTFMINLISANEKEVVLKVPQINTNSSIVLSGESKSRLFANSHKLAPLIQSEYRNSKPDKFSNSEIIAICDWVVIRTEIEEPLEIIASEGMNGGAMWFDDNLTFSFSEKSKLSILCNPLGAVFITQDGKTNLMPLREGKLYNVARINEKGWVLEIAIHKSLLVSDDGKMDLMITRERQQRGYQGFKKYENKFNCILEASSGANVPIICSDRQTFNDLNIVQGNYVNQLPVTKEDWAKLPAKILKPFQGGLPTDIDFQRTEVRIAANDSEFAFYITNYDKNLDKLTVATPASYYADEVELFFGPEGYQYIQIIADSKETIKANRGKTGGRRVPTLPIPKSLVVTRFQDGNSWSVCAKINIQEVLEISSGNESLSPKNYPWRVQVVRNRPEKKELGQMSQESILVATGSATAHAPLRFARLDLTTTPFIVKAFPLDLDLPKPVISQIAQSDYLPEQQVNKWLANKKEIALNQLNEELNRIKTKSEWEVYKAEKKAKILKSLFPATNGVVPNKTDLKSKIVYQIQMNEVSISGLLLMGRSGTPITITMFEPKDNVSKDKPCLLLVPAHHTSRNSNDLYTVAKNFCDQGGVVLTIDTMGSGERGLAPRWNHINHQRNLVGAQLKVAGEEILGWTVADIMSVVDYVKDRKDIDSNRIGIVGGVAGGGDLTAIAAALDERITLSIPFNFSHKNLVEAWYDYSRSYPGSIIDGVSPWLVCALQSPRHYIMAEEFAWSDKKQECLDSIKKIYDLYGMADRVESFHGWAESHALHFNYMHRIPMNKILNKWWGLKLPTIKEDEKFLKLNENYLEVMMTETGEEYVKYLWGVSKRLQTALSDRDLEVFNRSESNKLLKDSDTSELLKEPHLSLLEEIVAIRKKSDKKLNENAFLLKNELSTILGNTKPTKNEILKIEESQWHDFKVESLCLPLEDGLISKKDPASFTWLIKPNRNEKITKVVVCIAQAGKATFILNRKSEILNLLKNGTCVVLADLRDSGESESSDFRLPESIAIENAMKLWQMNESLIGYRVKDLRSVLLQISKRKDLDVSEGLYLWGEGFTAANGKIDDIFRFEETSFRQASPEGKSLVEGMGVIVCLMAALLTEEVKVKGIIGRGGLVSYESILHSRYHYIPQDIIIPGLIRHLDLPMIMNALEKSGVNLYLEDLRDGKNRVMSAESLKSLLPPNALKIYSNAVLLDVNNLINQ
jgi:hypothetical protein